METIALQYYFSEMWWFLLVKEYTNTEIKPLLFNQIVYKNAASPHIDTFPSKTYQHYPPTHINLLHKNNNHSVSISDTCRGEPM